MTQTGLFWAYIETSVFFFLFVIYKVYRITYSGLIKLKGSHLKIDLLDHLLIVLLASIVGLLLCFQWPILPLFSKRFFVFN